MANDANVVKLLNGLLTTELRAINQYFLDSKLAEHWGYEHLAEKFREASFEEMNDSEKLIDRILLLGGLPNLQRVEPFATGEVPREQFTLAIELETKALAQLREAIPVTEEVGDHGTGELLRLMLVGEEKQLDWLTTQVQLMDDLGDAVYLSQQVRS
jgi:bacterioferritin